MTHDYKNALVALSKYNPTYEEEDSDFLSEESCNRFGILAAPHHNAIRSALQLAQEAEQLRKERDELATAIIKIHEDQEGDYYFLKFISHPQYILAKKVSDQNG